MKLIIARVSEHDLIEVHVNKVTQGVYIAPCDGNLQFEPKEEIQDVKEEKK